MSTTFQLDGFEPIKRIGGGGFGDVWLAKQTNVDREVAVKVGHAPIQDETIRLRFDRECKALGRLSGHPNIVDVFTAGSLDDGRPYLVLEYIDGGTLWQQLKRGEVPEPDLISIGLQIAAALDKAHTSGILHRDLKPENILMRSTGEAVLGDFGIARLQDGANTTSAAITASVAYAAPEVLGGTKASVASDIYGVGICLLAAIIRSVPFVEKNDSSIHPIINRVLSESPPESRGHGISEALAETIDWTLDKNPSKRPQDASELHERFRKLRDGARASRAASAYDSDETTLFNNGDPDSPPPVPVQDPNSRHAVAGPAKPQMSFRDSHHSYSEPSEGSVALAPSFEEPAVLRPPAAHYDRDSESGRVASATEPAASRPSPESIRAFLVSYATTVVVGGLIVYLLARLFG